MCNGIVTGRRNIGAREAQDDLIALETHRPIRNSHQRLQVNIRLAVDLVNDRLPGMSVDR